MVLEMGPSWGSPRGTAVHPSVPCSFKKSVWEDSPARPPGSGLQGKGSCRARGRQAGKTRRVLLTLCFLCSLFPSLPMWRPRPGPGDFPGTAFHPAWWQTPDTQGEVPSFPRQEPPGRQGFPVGVRLRPSPSERRPPSALRPPPSALQPHAHWACCGRWGRASWARGHWEAVLGPRSPRCPVGVGQCGSLPRAPSRPQMQQPLVKGGAAPGWGAWAQGHCPGGRTHAGRVPPPCPPPWPQTQGSPV